MLVREEMNRVLLFLEWAVKQWDLRADTRSDSSPEVKEGLKAYTLEQAALQRTFAASFKLLWTTPLADVDDVLENLDFPSYSSDDDASEDEEDGDNDADTDGGAYSDNDVTYDNGE